MRLFADMDQPSRNIDVSLLKLMVGIVEGHPSDNVGEIALQFKGVLQDMTDGTLLTGHTRAAEALVAGCLTMDDIAQDIRLIVGNVLVELVEVGLLDMKLSVDEEGGTVNRVSLNPQLRNSIFFSPRYLFSQGGMELIESDTKEKAAFLLDLGINVNLAPVCDVPLTEGDFIYPRCFSTDAAETADYIRDVVGIMKDSGLGSTLKHFPGYGGSADTHKNMAYDDRGYDVFAARDFLPFEAGIARSNETTQFVPLSETQNFVFEPVS